MIGLNHRRAVSLCLLATVFWRAKVPFHTGVRLGLGLAQMFMAVFSAVLLIETGLSQFTLIAAGFTTVLTLTSRLLFHDEERK
jgi:hypothetical protein